MGKARFELARISPRDPKSRSSAHSDTSPSLWTLYYQRPILASECSVLINHCEALHQSLQHRRQKQKDKVDHSVTGDTGRQPILIADVAVDESQ